MKIIRYFLKLNIAKPKSILDPKEIIERKGRRFV